MTRIAIITCSHSQGTLATWEQSIPHMKKRGFQIAGLWLCQRRFPTVSKNAMPKWCLETFGFMNFAMIGTIFSMVQVVRRILSVLGKRHRNFASLCRAESVPYYEIEDANDLALSDWVRKEEIDIVLIQVDHIIREPLLSAPRLGMINGHPSLLPANKGVWSYIWAKINGQPQGASFHLVTRKIDAGPVLYREVIDEENARTMYRFYMFFFRNYDRMLVNAIDNLIAGTIPPPLSGLESSYPGWPTRQDYLRFTRCGGRIISFKDFWLACRRCRNASHPANARPARAAVGLR